MLKSTKVNSISLRRNGSAYYNSQQLRKLKLMVLASSEVDRCTNNKMTKAQKLRAAFKGQYPMGMVLIQTFTVLLTGIYIMVKLCFTEKEQTVSDLAAHLHILQMQ